MAVQMDILNGGGHDFLQNHHMVLRWCRFTVRMQDMRKFLDAFRIPCKDNLGRPHFRTDAFKAK